MIRALIFVKDDDRDYGKWHFAGVPVEGHIISLRVNDEPAFYRVLGVIHVPVMTPAPAGEESETPYMTVTVEPYMMSAKT